jgi:Tat protein secretion system quality control protein TatD with DNase activity
VISVASDKDLFEDNETFANYSSENQSTLPRVYGVYGMHPLYAKQTESDAAAVWSFLRRKLHDPKTIAYGEIGLDFHDFGKDANYASRDLQMRVFEEQLRMIQEVPDRKVPIVLHTREADDETFDVLRRYLSDDHPIDVHCCTSSLAFAERMLNAFRHVYFGFAGVGEHTCFIVCLNIVACVIRVVSSYFQKQC